MRHLLIGAFAFVAACFDASSAPSCTIACTTDSDCTEGQTCNTASGKCTAGEDCANPATCTPNDFVACVDGNARACNATGDGTVDTPCGAPGCNTTEKRCNACVPDETACSGDMTMVQHCAADGSAIASMETCAAGCVAGAGTTPAHCKYLEPKWLPNICDDLATADLFMPNASANYDSDLDTNCTGGVVPQPPGRALCVVRAKTITIGVTLTITGQRPIAFVADNVLTLTGTINASANNNAAGPGGSQSVSGGQSSGNNAGGGAGFGTAGAAGGGTAGTGQGGVGGQVLDPLTLAFFAGGPRSPSGGIQIGTTSGGGGGGAVLLATCRGGVNLTSTSIIDVGGGGGDPQCDILAGTGTNLSTPGAGGGAGGYVAIEALTGVSASGGIYANGGGGGGGNTLNDACGGIGGNGGRNATVGGTPGQGAGTGADGGRGASKGNAAVAGVGSTAGTAGGGGGGMGVVHVFTPMGVMNTITNTNMSPNPSVRITPTR